MGRIIRGTGDAKKVVLKKSPGGERKLRCMKCQGLAVPTRNAQGKEVTKCGTCGAEWVSKAF